MKRTYNIGKVWLALIGAGALIAAVACAYAYSYEDLQKKAEELLRSAEIREVYSYRFNTAHYFLLKDGRVVGVLWEKPENVSIGRIVETGWGAKAILVENGKVVGQLFVDGVPGCKQTKYDCCNEKVGWHGKGYRHGWVK